MTYTSLRFTAINLHSLYSGYRIQVIITVDVLRRQLDLLNLMHSLSMMKQN